MTSSVLAVDGEVLLSLGGVLDQSMAPVVRDQLVQLFAGDLHRVVVDLTDVVGVDATTVAVLVGLASHSQRRRVELVLLLPGPLPVVVSDPAQMRSLFDR